jgi:mRNA-degrading endonuclease toxin of MazEF toxin-antitoxin module
MDFSTFQTAFLRICHLTKNTEVKVMYKRGDIYEVETQKMGLTIKREAIIVSNDDRLLTDKYISMIILNDKKYTDRDVMVHCRGEKFVLCGLVTFIPVKKLYSYIKSVSEQELKEVDKSMASALGLTEELKIPYEQAFPKVEPVYGESEQLVAAQTERDLYKRLYDDLLDKMLKG